MGVAITFSATTASARSSGTWHRELLLTAAGEFRPHLLFVFASFGRELSAKIFGFENAPNFNVRVRARVWMRAALGPFDGFFKRLALPHPVTRDQLLGLRERTIDNHP